MSSDLVRPPSPGHDDCPAESVKAMLAGPERPGVDARPGSVRRAVLFGVGVLSLGTGVVGMFVPLLPTTCFLLLAAWCFGKSSPRLHQWMFHNQWFGVYLRDYKEGRGIPRAVKIGSLSLLWLTIGGTVVFAISVLWVRILLVGIALAVTAHVTMLRNSQPLPDERRA